MTYVVTANCAGCRFTDCVEVCPVDCFHGDELRLYIDPDACIDCGACAPECPVEAICAGNELAADQQHFLQLNAEKSAELPVVCEHQEPLPTARQRRTELGFT